MKSSKILTIIVFATILGSCEANTSQEMSAPIADQIALHEQPIVNGKLVTGDDQLATVALVLGSGFSSCTGTLISPNYVLTASHCISNCEGDDTNIVQERRYMRVGIGQSVYSLREIYDIEAFYPHPDFVCKGAGSSHFDMKNDVAVLKLKQSVPVSLARPIMVASPNVDMTISQVDSGSVEVTSVGFGKTSDSDTAKPGVKYETKLPVYAYCPNQRDRSSRCNHYGRPGFLSTYSETTCTCNGDSGGPLFWENNGIEYVVGIASYVSGGCMGEAGFTIVSDYYDFIHSHVPDLGATSPENCNNGIDDNNDNRIDCDDPYCFNIKHCIPEDCKNKKDDNDNGYTDCEDPQCEGAIACQPEICDDGFDNNDDQYIDCNDPQCRGLLICTPEICDNGVDDNGNNLIDCDDSQCERTSICLPEICDNNVDDNGDQKIDCNDPKCRRATVCQPENCIDGTDNNANGLTDCEDPQCTDYIACQPEICDDGSDNNDNGLTDCEDPECAQDASCQPSDSSSDCAAAPRSNHSSGWWWPFALASIALIGKSRRKCYW